MVLLLPVEMVITNADGIFPGFPDSIDSRCYSISHPVIQDTQIISDGESQMRILQDDFTNRYGLFNRHANYVMHYHGAVCKIGVVRIGEDGKKSQS